MGNEKRGMGNEEREIFNSGNLKNVEFFKRLIFESGDL